MLNQVTLIGRVTEALEDKDALIIVVRTGSGEKRAGGSWEELAACRFFGDAKKYGEKATPGSLVKVDGSVRSRQGKQGGWFSEFSARYLVVLEAGAKSAGTHRKVDATTSQPPQGDDDVPF